MPVKLSEKAMANKRVYDYKYARENLKKKVIPFNVNRPEDIALLKFANAQPENGNQYIKRLIREDMERRGVKVEDV